MYVCVCVCVCVCVWKKAACKGARDAIYRDRQAVHAAPLIAPGNYQ